MYSKESIEKGLDEIKNKYGDFSYDIPLPHGIWTRGNLNNPHTRLRRILQIANDLSVKPISNCRILDLGCLDGMFAIEFALHGADVVGIEVRELHVKKAIFCKEVLGLNKLNFIQEDARNISLEKFGSFDVIICSGLLYHLTADDGSKLIEKMFKMTNRLLIIDTHVGLTPKIKVSRDGKDYFGIEYVEHSEKDTQEVKSKRKWKSWDNNKSFWFTRASLTNLLRRAGFSSIYECFIPGEFEFRDRVTFVCIKDTIKELYTSPAVNGYIVDFPEVEGKLGYKIVSPANLFLRKVKWKLNQLKGKFS